MKKPKIETEAPSETPVEPPRSPETPKPESDGASLLNDLQRTRADFENYRKNVEKDKENLKKLTKFSTVEKILPLLYDLDRAISSYPK